MGARLKICEECGRRTFIGRSKKKCKQCRKGITIPVQWTLVKSNFDRRLADPKS